MIRRSRSPSRKSAFVEPSRLSRQNSSGPGAWLRVNTVRGATNFQLSWSSASRTADSCRSFPSLRRAVPTLLTASRAAEAVMAAFLSVAVGSRPSATHGNRRGSRVVTTICRTRCNIAGSRRSSDALRRASAKTARSSLDIGGPARYLKASSSVGFVSTSIAFSPSCARLTVVSRRFATAPRYWSKACV